MKASTVFILTVVVFGLIGDVIFVVADKSVPPFALLLSDVMALLGWVLVALLEKRLKDVVA